MKTSLRKLTNALLLVGLGFVLYYTGPLLHEIVNGGRATPQLESAPLLADSPRETAGNAYLYQCLVNLERRGTVEAELDQTGEIEGREVSSNGSYLRNGNGMGRRFCIKLDGLVAGEPLRLLQVSDGRFLWTDVHWGAAGQTKLQQAWRVDLRRIKNSLAPDPGVSLQVGNASAKVIDPQTLANLGGLPLLLESLQDNFDFALPRRMTLWNNIQAYVMIGFWKDKCQDHLFSPPDGVTSGLPSRAPHHVLIAIGASDLFPYLIEYRGVDDRLSGAEIDPNSRYFSSSRPLFKLKLMSPRFDAALPQEYLDRELAYDPPEGVDWTDRTSERLQMIQQRREIALAQIKRPVTPTASR